MALPVPPNMSAMAESADVDDEVLEDIELPSDSVPSAHEKTDADMEHDIKAMIGVARECAINGNNFKAEAVLRRVVKLTERLHGAVHMELAAHLSKLSAVQNSMGKELESKLNFERALYIYEILRNEFAGVDESSVGGEMRALKRRQRRREAQVVVASSTPPPSKQAQLSSPKRTPSKLYPLQELYRLPHQSMNYVDASIICTQKLTIDDLTPRSRQACLEREVDPNHLRVRDFHSFYAAHPQMPLDERKRRFVQWAKRREYLWKELLEDRYVLELETESKERIERMEREFDEMKRRRKAKQFGLDKMKNFDTSGLPKSVLPVPRWDFKYKGSVAAAIDASPSRPVTAEGSKRLTLKERIAKLMEETPLMCPACGTAWDFKQKPCRICGKDNNWNELQRTSHERSRNLKIMLERKEKLRIQRKKKKDEEEQRLLNVSLKIAQQKAEARRLQHARLLKQRQRNIGKRSQASGVEQDGQLSKPGSPDKGGSPSTASPKAHSPSLPKLQPVAEASVGANDIKTTAASETGTSGAKSPGEAADVGDVQSGADSPVLGASGASDGDGAAVSTKSPAETTEEELLAASRNVYVEAGPAGYFFPLLSTYAERDLSMRLERMKNPTNMSAEESLIRTIDRITRPAVDKHGRRRRLNRAAARKQKRDAAFQKRMYMYRLDNPLPKVKQVITSPIKQWGYQKPKTPADPSWVKVHGDTEKAKAKRVEYLMQQLHARQVSDAQVSGSIAGVQSDPEARRQMRLYAAMKGAKEQDEIVEMMDEAGLLSMPQEIANLKRSLAVDRAIAPALAK